MLSYSSLLRSSRLAALPPTIKASTSHDFYPTSPSIRTSRASQHVGDWGLKRSLPRLRTQNITISDIDTQEHYTPFQSSNKYTKVVQRWQEMAIPVKSQARLDHPSSTGRFLDSYDLQASLPENVNKGIYLASKSPKELKKLIGRARSSRSAFLETRGNEPSVYSSKVMEEMKKSSQQYLGIVSTTKHAFEVQPNAGLGYHPHGALSLVNRPDGALERTTVARVLHSNRNVTFVGLGGILAELKQRHDSISSRNRGRANVVKIYAGEMEVRPNGALNVLVEDIRPNQFDREKSLGVTPFLDVLAGGAKTTRGTKYTDHDMEPSEKSNIKQRSPFVNRLDALLESSPVKQNATEEK